MLRTSVTVIHVSAGRRYYRTTDRWGIWYKDTPFHSPLSHKFVISITDTRALLHGFRYTHFDPILHALLQCHKLPAAGQIIGIDIRHVMPRFMVE